MKLIITRPEEDAAPLAARLAGLGHEPVAVPLLAIAPRAGVEIPAAAYQAICFTSANAIRSAPGLAAMKALPAFGVGPQSAAAARSHGFTRASAHGGDVTELARYVIKHLKPEAGPLLYLSGAETSGDLAGILRKAGFSVERVITYDAMPCSLGPHRTDISAAEGVLLYSPRTARIWVHEIRAAGLEAIAAAMTHFCLSANVAASLPKEWPREISAAANEGAMLDLLEQAPSKG